MEKARGHLGLWVPSGRVEAHTTSPAFLLLNGKQGSGSCPLCCPKSQPLPVSHGSGDPGGPGHHQPKSLEYGPGPRSRLWTRELSNAEVEDGQACRPDDQTKVSPTSEGEKHSCMVCRQIIQQEPNKP